MHADNTLAGRVPRVYAIVSLAKDAWLSKLFKLSKLSLSSYVGRVSYFIIVFATVADALSTCLGLGLLSVHVARRLYQSVYVSIHSRHQIMGPLTLLSIWSFHVAAALSAVASGPEFTKLSIG